MLFAVLYLYGIEHSFGISLTKTLSLYIAKLICSRIDDEFHIKITDCALSRDLFPMDYHCLGDNENKPVKWMAVESLEQHRFTTASDVVSKICSF